MGHRNQYHQGFCMNCEKQADFKLPSPGFKAICDYALVMGSRQPLPISWSVATYWITKRFKKQGYFKLLSHGLTVVISCSVQCLSLMMQHYHELLQSQKPERLGCYHLGENRYGCCTCGPDHASFLFLHRAMSLRVLYQLYKPEWFGCNHLG